MTPGRVAQVVVTVFAALVGVVLFFTGIPEPAGANGEPGDAMEPIKFFVGAGLLAVAVGLLVLLLSSGGSHDD